jgi:GDPmannose 4,6-dehydratase
VEEFCAAAFARVGLDWRQHVVHDPGLSRTGDVKALVADPRRASARLGWTATTPFDVLLDELLDAACLALGVQPTRRTPA